MHASVVFFGGGGAGSALVVWCMVCVHQFNQSVLLDLNVRRKRKKKEKDG